MTKSTTIHKSSGNGFDDLELPAAQEYLAKTELAARIYQVIKRRKLTQSAAAKLLGINQPKVSALINGHLDGFSTDRLLRFLSALGCDVQITISRPHPRSIGRLQIVAV